MNMRSQQGALLISLIVTMVIMAALSGGMLYYSSSSSYGELLSNRQARAYYLGESGANVALQQFNPNTNYTNGPFYPDPAVFNLSNGQFSVKTYDKPGDPTRLIVESTGIVASGWLTTRQLVTKNFLKSSPILPGQVPTAPLGFDTNDNTQLDVVWTPTPDTDVSIVNTGPSSGPALQFQGFTGAINLDWYNNQAAGAPDMLADWNNNGQLLSYTMQVKINIDRQGSKGQHYMMGLSFRVLDLNNSYGISFYRSNNSTGPTWFGSSAFADFRARLPNDGANYAVLWKKVSGTYTVLAYALLDYAIYGDVVTDATEQTLSSWSSLFIKINERFVSGVRQNYLKAYVQGPSAYPIGTSNWNFTSFHQINWTWPAASNQIIDGTFTSEGFSSTRPEIGVHAFYDSNAANDQFFNGFSTAIQGTATGSGGYQY